MWLITSDCRVVYRQPYPSGALKFVFSSPAANVGFRLSSHTAWCRCTSVTGGALPSEALTRPGRKPTIQPFTAGRCCWTSTLMRFWPGLIVIGPYL